MNYSENKHDWKIGDLVIHDADAKEARMLMLVKKIAPDGLIVTEYLYPLDKLTITGEIKNDKKYLHCPKRFGIDIEHLKEG